MTAPRTDRDAFAGLFSGHQFDPALEAALLLKPTGILVAGWTRAPVPLDVLSVMAATMWGSLDTMVRALGGETPRSVYLELEGRLILAARVKSQWTLLLVAARAIGKQRLRQEAPRLLERVSRTRARGIARPDVFVFRG